MQIVKQTKTFLIDVNSPHRHAMLKSVLFWILFLASLILISVLARFFPDKYFRYITGIFGCISVLLITKLFLKSENQKFHDIGLIWESQTVIRFFIGFAVGTGIFLLMIGSLLFFGDLHIEQVPHEHIFSILFWSGIIFIPGGFMEEIAYRSYPFIRLKSAYGIRITLIITAIAFALYHVVGGQGIFSSFMGPGIWAFVFGIAAIWSGGIALPAGLHIALNVLQAFFGMKQGYYEPMWKLVDNNGNTEGVFAQTQNIGITIQVVLLLVTLGIMEGLIRRKSNKNNISQV